MSLPRIFSVHAISSSEDKSTASFSFNESLLLILESLMSVFSPENFSSRMNGLWVGISGLSFHISLYGSSVMTSLIPWAARFSSKSFITLTDVV